ncbi:MAG TPA: CAP domain-containing protein [Spirochaetota bacterium]|nr:CAP domain-containing protein [Spirochaetota bacterium]HOL56911.1 CAP domain-containing protein [Spirochaetota bacterium]HPP04314.1 CAP domain-containing protein [Spirochaetota bacterium]
MRKIFTFIFILGGFLLFAEINVQVFPINKQQSSGVYVRKGESIKIEVKGEWSLWDKYKPVGGEGHPFNANEFGNWGVLLGRIGNGDIFVVGKGTEIKSNNDGILYLFPNKGKYLIENPSGSLNVTIIGGITVEEWINSLLSRGKKIEFDPKNGFLNTKLYIKEGTTLEIYAIGYWTMWDGVYPEVNAEGHEFIANGIPWGKLIGGIGASYGVNNYTFSIGEKNIIKIEKAGLLTLYPHISNYVAVKNGKMDIYIIGGNEATEEEIQKIDNEVRKEIEIKMIDRLNSYRKALGLPDLVINESLSNCAFGHAKYLAINKLFTRDQEQGKPGFTGITFEERLKNSGFIGKAREMFCQTDLSDDPLNLFFNSVYQRLRLMNPEINSVGYGSYRVDDDIIHVFNFGYIGENDTPVQWDVIKYPNDNATNVNPVWNGIENPDPLPKGTAKPVGIPVSILFKEQIKNVVKAELKDPEGKVIDSILIYPGNDINNKQINSVTIIPKMMLNKFTKYTVYVEVELGASGEKKTFSWSFETGEPKE